MWMGRWNYLNLLKFSLETEKGEFHFCSKKGVRQVGGEHAANCMDEIKEE